MYNKQSVWYNFTLWKNFYPVNILLIFGDGSLYHDAIRDATKNDLPQSQKITPRKSVFIEDSREVRKVEYFFLFMRHVLYGHGAIMWYN